MVGLDVDGDTILGLSGDMMVGLADVGHMMKAG
jgi:hypothetical protein